MSAANPPQSGTEWIAGDSARLALRLRARREVAASDLFLPLDGRLRDDDRATIAGLLTALVATVERALRLHLAVAFADRPMLAESLVSSRIPIAWSILERAGALRDAALVATLARRAEEARLIARLRAAFTRALELDPDLTADPIGALAGDADADVAAAATRLAAASQSRRDPQGAPVPGAAELPAEVQHRLVWRVAAALRDYIVASQTVEPGLIDPPIAAAVMAVLAGYDEGQTLAALAQALARALHAADRLGDAPIVAALAAGEPGFAAAALGVRGGIGFDAAWDMMVDPDPARLLLLCRAAGMTPEHAADLMLRLATGEDDEALADRIDAYDTMPPHRASAALSLWRIDPAYLESIAALVPGVVG